MKTPKKTYLNVIMKESASLENPMETFDPMEVGDGPKMTRLLDVNSLINDQPGFKIASLASEDRSARMETLNAKYDSMSPEEKKLYRIWQVEIKPSEDIEEVKKRYQSDPNVESVEIDDINELYFQTNDPRYGELYGLKKIECEDAWKESEGDDIIVAVLDTGVDYNHPDIKDNMWVDVNGHFGVDFSDNDNDPMDYHGHGTHVAGTIAAVRNNAIGIVGVAPKVKIMALKIFPKANNSVIVQALKYAVDNGARVLNNSWGPRSRRPQEAVLEAAIDYVHSKGAICVFAAGNENDETKYYFPANYTKTISVGATDDQDKKAIFSNYGQGTDISAPGVDILSLFSGTSGYTLKNGTSMACPHVAGAIALLLSKHPGLTYDQVKDRLLKAADPIPTKPYIGGRLNAKKLLR